MMFIENKFELGEIVYLKTDIDQIPRMITCFKVTPNGIIYGVSWEDKDSYHYDLELSLECDEEKKLDI